MGRKKGKKGIVTAELPWWIIALVILVLLMIFTLILKELGISFIDKIRNIGR
ncbi:MAG TPA: hypothetical protein VJ142_01415 [Candidatus Nanoarchaeia archaeon]|nr:hypothetical protein [Candidatus Nanoarchaeia archaeon]